MKKKMIIAASVLAVVAVAYFVFKETSSENLSEVVVPVNYGNFKVEIETTGELEAKSSVPIMGPNALRNFRIYSLTIQKMVDEGTVVRKGQWIATLDKSEFQGRLQDKQIELDQANSQYVQTQLDTTLQMRLSRDELINLQYNVEEMEIILEQSKFEPPATIKQAEINVEKARRSLNQAKQNYRIKKRQATEQMREVATKLRKVQRDYNDMVAVEESFTIKAPEPGMVIYKKGSDGRQVKEGSQISVWDPTVATLPDLSVMLSKTYVNEVDVRKVQSGQKVEIGLDAFPDKTLRGVVTRVANVGEQRPNSDAKVFQVNIEIKGSDPSLKPAMTTSNKILALEIDSVLFVPLECLHSKDDSISFVYKKEGLLTVKQEVGIGDQNSDDVVILQGLDMNDRVFLSVPEGLEDVSIAMLPQLDGKRRKKEEEVKEVDLNIRTITMPDGRTMPVPAERVPGEGSRTGNGTSRKPASN